MNKDGLIIKNLHVYVEEKHILKGVNLEIKPEEIHIIFGPNGSGKSTLLKVLMGIGNYKIKKGEIYFNGVNILNLTPEKRASLGIGLAFQKPPAIKGVRLATLLNYLNAKNNIHIAKYLNFLNFIDHIERDVNLGFSGGELKKSEILQLIVQNPEFIMLDEPESGVDLENLKKLGQVISDILDNKLEVKDRIDNEKKIKKGKKMGLIITHTGYILDYIKADKAHILIDGRFICHGHPLITFNTIQKYGFKECELCKVLKS